MADVEMNVIALIPPKLNFLGTNFAATAAILATRCG
jgi:hypothetical protein